MWVEGETHPEIFIPHTREGFQTLVNNACKLHKEHIEHADFYLMLCEILVHGAAMECKNRHLKVIPDNSHLGSPQITVLRKQFSKHTEPCSFLLVKMGFLRFLVFITAIR